MEYNNFKGEKKDPKTFSDADLILTYKWIQKYYKSIKDIDSTEEYSKYKLEIETIKDGLNTEIKIRKLKLNTFPK